MFRKLISNLPFNPSLINQVSFYAKRLHKEERLRRTGAILVVLAVMVQLFAVISPPEPTLANSTNDIIPGGFATRDQAVLYCLDTRKDFGKIFAYYGVTCDMIASASTEYLNSRAHNDLLDSLGRNDPGNFIQRTGKPTNKYQVNIPGVQTLWMKNLWAWDSGASSTYKVLRVVNRHGNVIWIMYDCGNIVTIHEYEPPTPPPPPPTPTPTPTPTPQPTPGNEAVCVSLVATQLGPLSYRFRAQTAGSDFVVTSYNFTFGDGNSRRVDTGLYARTVDHTYAQGGNYTARVSITVNDQGTGHALTRTLACQAPIVVASTPTPVVYCTDANKCLELSKAARNSTQDIDNADGTTAAGGDRIVYTLKVKNIGDATYNDFVVEENINDILDYATVTDYNGGKLDEKTGYVSWPAVDIRAGQTVTRTLVVRTKDPVPQTPVSASDPGRFDLVMTNTYGNTINIQLPGSPAKTTEQIGQTLPNTGPGEVLAVGVGLTVIVSYFFARSRLLAKEIDIVREDYAVSGSV